MPKKLSKTALNIRSINSYIQTVARVFGTGSAEYQAATVPLKQFDIRDKHVNGQTIVQIKNTAENRKKHQTIRAIKNRRKPVQILKRRYEKQKKTFLQNIPSIERGEKAKEFYRWYAEISREFDDLWDEIYNNLDPSCGLFGITLDKHQAFIDETYRMDKWETVYEKGGKNYTNLDDFFANFEPVNGNGVDENTGENMTFTNDDYDMDMEFD